MKWNKGLDVVVNIISPVLVGDAIYYWKQNFLFISFIKNHLADGLWAYAFYSSILIIWNRQFNWLWLIMALIISFVFEYLQYIHTIPGTGDWIDIYTYLFFFLAALYLNKYFNY